MLISLERVQVLVLPGHGELITWGTVLLGKMAVSRIAKIPQDSFESRSSINMFKSEGTFGPKLPGFQKSTALGGIQLRPVLLPVRARCRRRWLWSTGGMILTGENRSTRKKTCLRATLSTTNLTWTELESKPGLRSGRPATNRLSHDTPVRR